MGANWSSLLLILINIVLAGIKAQGVNNPAYLWPNATVPYEISTQYSTKDAALIRNGLAEIAKYTCIQFVPRTNEADYVTYMEYKDPSQPRGTCWAGKWGSVRVGNQKGQHIISLWRDLSCLKTFDIIHEMLHILGFFHEQTRGDRDNYIYVDKKNINPNYLMHIYDTKKENSGPEQQITYLGTSFDTDSIMQYHPFAFALDPKRPVMSPKNPCNPLGNEVQLSPIDVARINKLYKCSGGKPVPPVVDKVLIDWHSINPNCTADAKAGRCESEPMYMNSVCGNSCCERQTCVDKDRVNCPIWAMKGECTKNPDYMLTNCLLSCGQCSSKFCKDNNDNCAFWAGNGECTKNPGFMLPICAKSCNQCSSYVATPKKSNVNNLEVFSATTEKSDCTDEDQENCPYWASSGECEKNPSYMLLNCAGSCNPQCCMDNNVNCASWASSGECKKNPGYMSNICKASCQKCSSEGFTTTEDSVNSSTAATKKSCIDKVPEDCPYWASNGECEKNPKYMLSNCAGSCNPQCCMDGNENCAFWAGSGECENNPSYMFINCKASCKKCYSE